MASRIGHAGEVLQENTRGHEGNLGGRRGFGIPLGNGADVVRLHEGVVLAAQQVLQQDLHGVRQARDTRKTGFL
jgi:hypothetical protein